MYQRPDMITPGVDPQGDVLDSRKIQDHFEDFYDDLFEELSYYGEIESLNVCDNFGRPYGRPIVVDFSPVTDFREATCRQYEENVCNQSGYCNFMHLKKISREPRKLFGRSRHWQSRSRSPHTHRGYAEHSAGASSGKRDDDRDRRHHDRAGGLEVGHRSPVRESSAERRAKIEQWNRDKEQEYFGSGINANTGFGVVSGGPRPAE